MVDILQYTRWTKLGVVYGANAITSYVLAGMLTLVFFRMEIGGTSINYWVMNGFTLAGLPPKLGSMIYAICYMLIIYIPAWILYKRKIFIRV